MNDYTSQNDLQTVVTGLVDQRIKQLVEQMIFPKFSTINTKKFEYKDYNLQSDVTKATIELANQLFILISEYVKANEIELKRINPDFKNSVGVGLYHHEKT
ncbi:MAG TPA: hypothetical protein VFS71_08985 [Flavobacterium sp.]|uniref:hypothetical protein n=1 Tax=Flavobacterium sp. TaxID=239 RepID=UPI002DBB0EF4|nr:hypothetical protein [Flavobacterium sp.]HEU4789806.1 hypothetical protein [Flavobacterium sp.]